MPTSHTWEIWLPEPAATGLLFARTRIQPADVVWIHAAPAEITVTVREDDERVVARSKSLFRTSDKRLPMTRLALSGGSVTREDRWPSDADLGAVVVLPGGEAATLVSWWNSAAEDEWRWRVEFYNHT